MLRQANIIRDTLGDDVQTYVWQNRIHFRLNDAWSLSISQDSMSRLRLDIWRGRRRCDSLWVLRGDEARLADLARSAEIEVAALAA